MDAPDPAGLPTSPSDALWTSDSQRADTAATTELAPDEPPAPETPETAPELQTQAERDEAGKFKKPSGKPRNDPQARVQQATATAAAAKDEARKQQERADRLERELAQARQSAQPPAQTTRQPERPQTPAANGKPSWGTFESQIGTTYETWSDAQEAWADARDTWKDDQRTWQAAFDEIDQAKAADPDFARAAASLPCSPVMGQAIRDSKHRLDIMRFLSTHPETCIQLATESDRVSLDAVPVMRRYLEAQVSAGAVAKPDAAPAVHPSTAAPPIHRVGGTASAIPVNPDDLDFGPDYIRAENARERKRQAESRW